MWFLLTFLIVGFFAGLIAKALVSGPSPAGCLGTTFLGVIGSFVGGFLGYVIFDKDITKGAFQTSGLLGSLIGAVIVLMIYRQTKKS